MLIDLNTNPSRPDGFIVAQDRSCLKPRRSGKSGTSQIVSFEHAIASAALAAACKRASRKSVGGAKSSASRTPSGQKGVSKDRRFSRNRHRSLKRVREPSFQELAQLRCHLELRNGLQFLETRSERIRETPDRAWLEFLALRFEVEIVHRACEVCSARPVCPPRTPRR